MVRKCAQICKACGFKVMLENNILFRCVIVGVAEPLHALPPGVPDPSAAALRPHPADPTVLVDRWDASLLLDEEPGAAVLRGRGSGAGDDRADGGDNNDDDHYLITYKRINQENFKPNYFLIYFYIYII